MLRVLVNHKKNYDRHFARVIAETVKRIKNKDSNAVSSASPTVFVGERERGCNSPTSHK